VPKYRWLAGFWLCLILAGWLSYGVASGLEVVANHPNRNDIVFFAVPLVLIFGMTIALLIRRAFGFRRKSLELTRTPQPLG
jgi:predicted Na+-dependent transporter